MPSAVFIRGILVHGVGVDEIMNRLKSLIGESVGTDYLIDALVGEAVRDGVVRVRVDGDEVELVIEDTSGNVIIKAFAEGGVGYVIIGSRVYQQWEPEFAGVIRAVLKLLEGALRSA